MKYKFTKPLSTLQKMDNIYGYLLAIDEATGKQTPIICGHEGEKWLCFTCACKITAFQEFDNIKEIVEYSCPVCPLCGMIIYPDSNWSIYRKAKDSLVAVHMKCLRDNL